MSTTPCGVVVKAEVQAWSAQCTSLAQRQLMLRMACAIVLLISPFTGYDIEDGAPALIASLAWIMAEAQN